MPAAMLFRPAHTPDDVLVSLRGVSKSFGSADGVIGRLGARLHLRRPSMPVTAVSETMLEIRRGEAMGLVGESGCGKSTLGRIAAGLLKPSTGEVRFDGQRIDKGASTLPARELLRIQMVFQNPLASLNPRQRVIDILTEGALYHRLITPRQRVEFATHLLDEVGMPADALLRLPHQFSGGQRQRIGIARALSVEPQFLVCDEPVAALDVSIQAQIINLLLDLRRRRGLTMLFISHDLGVVRHLCDRVSVMYLGEIVERADAQHLFSAPRHPYTEALLQHVPRLRSGRRNYVALSGEIPSPLHLPAGCRFHPRCPRRIDICSQAAPPATVDTEGEVRCWLAMDSRPALPADAMTGSPVPAT